MIRAENIEKIKEVIVELLNKMGVQADIETREQPNALVFNIRGGRDSHILIGQHGVNLAALQYLLRVLARRKLEDPVKFVLDVDNYKKKRESYLVSLAEQVRKEAIAMRKSVVIKPLSAYERRIVHTALAQYSDVSTASVNEEPNRLLVVSPIEADVPSLPEDFKVEEEYAVIE